MSSPVAPASLRQENNEKNFLVCRGSAGMDGKVWHLDRLVQTNFPIETLNIPQAFSLEPQVLMVPSDAL